LLTLRRGERGRGLASDARETISRRSIVPIALVHAVVVVAGAARKGARGLATSAEGTVRHRRQHQARHSSLGGAALVDPLGGALVCRRRCEQCIHGPTQRSQSWAHVCVSTGSGRKGTRRKGEGCLAHSAEYITVLLFIIFIVCGTIVIVFFVAVIATFGGLPIRGSVVRCVCCVIGSVESAGKRSQQPGVYQSRAPVRLLH
jgi:cytochrome bd-type quinol oxidase subunit 2